MSSDFNWFGPLMTFLVPLGLGIVCLLASYRVGQRWALLLLRFFGGAALIIFLLLVFFMSPYLWALHLESKWQAADPKTRADLEHCLSLYSRHDLEPSRSALGSRFRLEPGEHLTEYWLLYSPAAPLDVVYTNDTIERMYPSYE